MGDEGGATVTTGSQASMTVTLAQRPDLAAGLPDLLAARWPQFMVQARPGHDVDLIALLTTQVPEHQVVLLDPEQDSILGVGLSVPVGADDAALPQGWDAAVSAGAAFVASGTPAGTVSALSITMTGPGAGRGLSARLVQGLKDAAAAAGAGRLIAPVRPTRKAQFPLIALPEYLRWRTAQGQVFDPWVRLHLQAGGVQGQVAHESMTLTGAVAQWQSWTGLELPGSGAYVLPGGLAPLHVDCDTDIGVYREPNVWITHPLR